MKYIMIKLTNKLNGASNKIAGNVKEAIGEAIEKTCPSSLSAAAQDHLRDVKGTDKGTLSDEI